MLGHHGTEETTIKGGREEEAWELTGKRQWQERSPQQGWDTELHTFTEAQMIEKKKKKTLKRHSEGCVSHQAPAVRSWGAEDPPAAAGRAEVKTVGGVGRTVLSRQHTGSPHIPRALPVPGHQGHHTPQKPSSPITIFASPAHF